MKAKRVNVNRKVRKLGNITWGISSVIIQQARAMPIYGQKAIVIFNRYPAIYVDRQDSSEIVNETLFVGRKTVVVQLFARFQTNLGNLRISQDICYVRMTDNNGFLTMYGHRTSLLNNNVKYLFLKRLIQSLLLLSDGQ